MRPQSHSQRLGVYLLCLLSSARVLAEPRKASAVLPLRASLYGTQFDAKVDIGGQSFHVLADTGSADLWVLAAGWECFKTGIIPSGNGIPQADCNFGDAVYHPSSTLEPINNSWFGEHYGQGNDIGTLGFEQVKLGNLTIARQETGFVNQSADIGDGLVSGVMGLGYPVLAGVHPEGYVANSSEGLLLERWKYDTVTTSLFKSGVESYFSFAFERTPLAQESGFGGYLGIGAMPPVAYSDFVTVPVEVTKSFPAALTNGSGVISEWTTSVKGVGWNDQTYSESFQAVVDTGNWRNAFPKAVVSRIAAAFDPPGVWNSSYDAYTVACNATPPSNVIIQLGSKAFTMDPADMIWMVPDGTCFSIFSPSDSSSGISLSFIGSAFLKNVVVVFDVGKNEMRFAPRSDNNTSTRTGTSAPSPSATGAASTIGANGWTLVAVAACVFAIITA